MSAERQIAAVHTATPVDTDDAVVELSNGEDDGDEDDYIPSEVDEDDDDDYSDEESEEERTDYVVTTLVDTNDETYVHLVPSFL